MEWEEHLAKDIAYWFKEAVKLHRQLNKPPDE
jgi:hypothetical protein